MVFYNKFLAVCFDQEFAQLRGVRVNVYYMLLLCLTALTIVILLRVVGIVLVIALLTLPAAVAGHFARQLWQMMILAIAACGLFTVVGLGGQLSHRSARRPGDYCHRRGGVSGGGGGEAAGQSVGVQERASFIRR